MLSSRGAHLASGQAEVHVGAPACAGRAGWVHCSQLARLKGLAPPPAVTAAAASIAGTNRCRVRLRAICSRSQLTSESMRTPIPEVARPSRRLSGVFLVPDLRGRQTMHLRQPRGGYVWPKTAPAGRELVPSTQRGPQPLSNADIPVSRRHKCLECAPSLRWLTRTAAAKSSRAVPTALKTVRSIESRRPAASPLQRLVSVPRTARRSKTLPESGPRRSPHFTKASSVSM